MNIVILGAGSIGSYLALILSQEGQNVTVIDRDPKALERVSRSADIATRLGNGIDWRLLEELKEVSPDFFIALSSNDETNLTACAIAKDLGYPKTVARIRQKSFLDHRRMDFGRIFGVDHIIGTELVVAHDLYQRILHPGNLAVENFAHGAVQMRTVVVPHDFSEAGKPLANVNLKENLLVGLIRRKNKGIIFPKGKDQLLPGDEATVIGPAEAMHQLHQLFGIPKKTIRSAVIVGASGVAIHLIELLLIHNISIKIIEQDEVKCQKLAHLFPTITILNQDGTNLHFLKEEKIFASDVFVACTHSHETNVLVALLGKQAGANEVIALVSEENTVPLLEQFKISYALSERESIARRIQVILHDDTFISLASLYDNQAKIMEVRVSEDSHLVKRPLSSLSSKLPKNFLIAMVENQKGITIPKGDNQLQAGDTAIVICGPESVEDVEKML
jgi:trk system potassium uptake protein TrkA